MATTEVTTTKATAATEMGNEDKEKWLDVFSIYTKHSDTVLICLKQLLLTY